ncbi:MAG: SHOCT domain-containing protein, partial [Oscillatoria sp. PMC 1076.18]|nr:SHOCT domain-containing protein [Oscillatoria sp. PMC 1076.18]
IAGAGWALVVENEIVTYVENTLNFAKVKKENEVEGEESFTTDSNLTNSESPISDSRKAKLSARELAVNQVAKDLEKLQAAYDSEILTEEEFNTKKLNLEEKIDEYEIEFVLEEQLAKLENAFTHGILNEKEYEQKLATIQDTVREQILKKRSQKNKEVLKIKLKEALEDGILSEAEYQAKIAEL